MNKLVLIVVTVSGYVFMYDIDVEIGGECALGKQHSLLDPEDDD